MTPAAHWLRPFFPGLACRGGQGGVREHGQSDVPIPAHIGTGRSAIGMLVERSSRSTLLVHLPRLEGWGARTRR